MQGMFDYVIYIALGAFVLPVLLKLMPSDKIKFNPYPLSAALLVAGVVYLDYPKTTNRNAPGSIGDYAQMALDWMDFWIPLAFHLMVAMAALALAYKLYEKRWL